MARFSEKMAALTGGNAMTTAQMLDRAGAGTAGSGNGTTGKIETDPALKAKPHLA